MQKYGNCQQVLFTRHLCLIKIKGETRFGWFGKKGNEAGLVQKPITSSSWSWGVSEEQEHFVCMWILNMLYCSPIHLLQKKELLACFPGEGRALEKALPAPCSLADALPQPVQLVLWGVRDLQSTQHKHQDVPPLKHQHCSSSICPFIHLTNINKDNDFKNPVSITDDFSVAKLFTSLGWRRCEDFQDGASCALWPGERYPHLQAQQPFALREIQKGFRSMHTFVIFSIPPVSRSVVQNDFRAAKQRRTALAVKTLGRWNREIALRKEPKAFWNHETITTFGFLA